MDEKNKYSHFLLQFTLIDVPGKSDTLLQSTTETT